MKELIFTMVTCFGVLTAPAQEKKLRDTLQKDGDEVVVTGNMKEMTRKESAIPIEVYSSKFFKKNPTPNLFEAVGMINGVKPQLNCNVCNTGDIHINGMEGPYTLILIDGMPIVSSLSTVYGLSGIPNSIVERVEVVKGPAAAMYGSEAMGGLINVITKSPLTAPLLSVDVNATSWQEYNVDLSLKQRFGKLQSLLGINYFNYNQRVDKNDDGFTDVTLQHRIAVFNKWNLERKEYRVASLAARYVYEDRWGGQTNWNNEWRGSDSIYGESVYTKRWELTGMYQLPLKEKIFTQFSYNLHDQNSFYGIIPYMATQQTGFAQAYWSKGWGNKHDILAGISVRYNYYDDNTTATQDIHAGKNQPAQTVLPGLFLQDEWKLNDANKLLLGYRFDYDSYHGGIHSPRLAYKFSPDQDNTLRISLGSGFRVVNIFTEDHAALTGAREVVIADKLSPERSYNTNLNYVRSFATSSFFGNIDVTGFYSYFTNKIIADYDTDPQKIIYNNLNGYAVSRGISVNTEINLVSPLKLIAGITYMDVFQQRTNQAGEKEKSFQMHAPKWSGNFLATYLFKRKLSMDLTGNWYSPMRLPVFPNDYRPAYSPWFCIVNLQATKQFKNGLEVYGGVKNIFDFTPSDPIMRPQDPFDKTVNDPVNNPNNYTFDPSYNYASLQGRRFFLGVRFFVK
ncbi:MAG TPA: TonB-dependent receptor [Flavipsychrobacter sp.]|nr:TonB-dependent receptor [Flavipsychrobacter sp.]